MKQPEQTIEEWQDKSLEDLSKFVPTIFDPEHDQYDKIREDIWHLLKVNVDPQGVKLEDNPDFTEEKIKNYFLDPENTLVLLTDEEDGRIKGFTFAIYDYDELEVRTAYIYTTKIDPKYQGKKLVVKLMDSLEAELIKKGYKQITRDARISNGYADKIQKTYGDRIIESKEHTSPYGSQRFFKIRLKV
jgi:ribosomal protein S18 acetylase RimI-like enzyme